MSSGRDQIVCTVTPLRLAAMVAAWQMKSTSSRRPKAPPMNCWRSSTLSVSSLSVFATQRRASPGICVAAHTMARSSWTSTVQLTGSSAA
ncbi:hypothetical protein D3C87_1717040 [compost metagenome]